ncbi:MAG: alpha/beta hydrolase-fold protein [Cyclonatronaceae bacterium]
MKKKQAVQVKKWGSPSLGKQMQVNIYGTGGTPVLAFPDYNGKASDYSSLGFLDQINEQLTNEYNRFYCVSTVDKDVFNTRTNNPDGRLGLYIQYENYIMDEVIPFIKDHSGNDFLIVTGVGMGAYHALNFAFKHPETVNKVLAACGRYNIKPFFNDYFSELLYYNNPIEYFPNLNDQDIIDRIKRLDIRIITNNKDPYRSEAEMISDALNDKWIHHSLDLWEVPEKCSYSDYSQMLRNHIP